MTPREELASLLRQARLDAGYSSQAKLAAALHVSRPLISRAENAGEGVPSADVIAGYLKTTRADADKIAELAERIKSGTPGWFMPYLVHEAAAKILRCWSPIVVPGIAQTQAYMRALFEDEGNLPGKVDELSKTRLERQAVIDRVHVTMIIGQHVLYRPVRSPSVMTDQCAHLADLAECSGVALHIVPEKVNIGAWGAFDVAANDSAVTVCLESIEDITSNAPDMVSKILLAFERILGAALPRSDSLTLVRSAEEQWKTQT